MRLLILPLLLFSPLLHAENWPGWRGPGGQGISTEKDLPLHWNSTENIKWKLALPNAGNSVPVIWDDRIFLTQASKGGTNRMLLCLDRKDGRVLWKKTVVYEKEEPSHKGNPYCSASPVTDGERVIVFHGSAGVYCYDFNGKELWQRDLGEFRHVWGNASSPVIHNELCFLNCGPGVRTFLIALNKHSGKTVWKKQIAGGKEDGSKRSRIGSWSTPLIYNFDGKDTLLMTYPHQLYALEPDTGKEVWNCEGLGDLVYTSPITDGNIVVAMSGFGGPSMAVRAGGSGDVSETHQLWWKKRAPQSIGSGVIHKGHIYILHDTGVMICTELTSGNEVWKEKVSGNCWSSMVLADGNLYITDQQGTCHLVKAAPEYQLIAQNPLGELTRSSVAIAKGKLYIRTYEHLYCIEVE